MGCRERRRSLRGCSLPYGAWSFLKATGPRPDDGTHPLCHVPPGTEARQLPSGPADDRPLDPPLRTSIRRPILLESLEKTTRTAAALVAIFASLALFVMNPSTGTAQSASLRALADDAGLRFGAAVDADDLGARRIARCSSSRPTCCPHAVSCRWRSCNPSPTRSTSAQQRQSSTSPPRPACRCEATNCSAGLSRRGWLPAPGPRDPDRRADHPRDHGRGTFPRHPEIRASSSSGSRPVMHSCRTARFARRSGSR